MENTYPVSGFLVPINNYSNWAFYHTCGMYEASNDNA